MKKFVILIMILIVFSGFACGCELLNNDSISTTDNSELTDNSDSVDNSETDDNNISDNSDEDTNEKTYTVRFYDGSTLIKSYTIAEGSSLTDFPVNPVKEKEGNYFYVFDKWITATNLDARLDISKVENDLNVYAKYERVRTFSYSGVEIGFYGFAEKTDGGLRRILLPTIKGNITNVIRDGVSVNGYVQKGESIELSDVFIENTLKGKQYGDFDFTIKTVADGVTHSYPLKLAIVTKIINTAEDLENVMEIATANTQKYTIGGYDNVSQTADGYFVLNSNIDYGGKSFGLTANGGDGFVGIFDGRGYTVKNVQVKYESEGLFGHIGVDGVVRNIAFQGVRNTTNNGNESFVRRNILCFVLNGKIENVYLEATRGKITGVAPFSGTIGQYQSGATVKNLVVLMTESSDKNNNNYIGTAIGAMMNYATSTSPISNVITVSSHYNAIGINPDGEFDSSVNGVESYQTIAAIKGAENEYSMAVWNEDIWDISGSYPIFIEVEEITDIGNEDLPEDNENDGNADGNQEGGNENDGKWSKVIPWK